MIIRNDDEVYRVDSVWLGPPNATFPWRARYVSYGLGLLILIIVLVIERRLGIEIGVFSIAWALLITVVAVRFLGRRIGPERPLSHVLGSLVTEIRTPRRKTTTAGGELCLDQVRVRSHHPTDKTTSRGPR